MQFGEETDESPILNFYINGTTNTAGKTFADIMRYSYSQMERGHNYIQWLFPTIEPSAYLADAPVLTPAEIYISCKIHQLRSKTCYQPYRNLVIF
jgi:hypothetical protein